MGIAVLSYAVMSNHFHCVVRSRHDVVATWSDDEVARKWWMLWSVRKNPDGSPAEPAEVEREAIRNDRKGLKENVAVCLATHGLCGFCPKRSRRMPTSRKQGPPPLRTRGRGWFRAAAGGIFRQRDGLRSSCGCRRSLCSYPRCGEPQVSVAGEFPSTLAGAFGESTFVIRLHSSRDAFDERRLIAGSRFVPADVGELC